MSNEIEIFQGDNETLQVEVVDDEGEIVVLLGNEPVYFTVRRKIGDSSFSIQKKSLAAGGSNSEINITDPNKGILEIYILPVDTKTLEANRYVYDVQLTYNFEIKTIVKSIILLKKEVTQ